MFFVSVICMVKGQWLNVRLNPLGVASGYKPTAGSPTGGALKPYQHPSPTTFYLYLV